MLLGLSSGVSDQTVDLGIVRSDVDPTKAGETGVANGELLAAFADAVHDRRPELVGLRSAVIDALGPAGFVDAAAICANFNMMVRIADGTGTPLDVGTATMSEDLRDDLGLDDLVSRRIATSG